MTYTAAQIATVIRKRDALRFARRHREAPFTAPAAAPFTAVVVSRTVSGESSPWRVTRFDADGPAGHTEAASHRDAVLEAARQYRADLARARFMRKQ